MVVCAKKYKPFGAVPTPLLQTPAGGFVKPRTPEPIGIRLWPAW
jgi:hypothetical protein